MQESGGFIFAVAGQGFEKREEGEKSAAPRPQLCHHSSSQEESSAILKVNSAEVPQRHSYLILHVHIIRRGCRFCGSTCIEYQ